MGTDAESGGINRKGDELMTAYITANNNSGKALIDKDVLGTFRREKDAAQAYNDAAKEFFGEYALLNNLEECI